MSIVLSIIDSVENWYMDGYHGTRLTDVKSIMKKGIVPSKNTIQGFDADYTGKGVYFNTQLHPEHFNARRYDKNDPPEAHDAVIHFQHPMKHGPPETTFKDFRPDEEAGLPDTPHGARDEYADRGALVKLGSIDKSHIKSIYLHPDSKPFVEEHIDKEHHGMIKYINPKDTTNRVKQD